MDKESRYLPEVFISKDKTPSLDGEIRNISVGVFRPPLSGKDGKPIAGYGTQLPRLSLEEARELYRALRKTLIKAKHNEKV